MMTKRLGTFAALFVAFLAGFLLNGRLTVSGQPAPAKFAWAAVPGVKGGEEQTGPYDYVQGWPKPLSGLPGHQGWSWSAVQSVFAQNPNRILMTQRGELPDLKRPEAVPLPNIGPNLAFPISQYPFRNASQAPNGALPGGFGDVGPDGNRLPNYVLKPNDVTHPSWKGTYGVDARWEHCVVVIDAQGNILPETDTWKKWDGLFGYPHTVMINPYDPEKNVWIVEAARHAIYKFSNDGTKLLQTLGTPNAPGSDATHFNRPTFVSWLPDSTMFVADGYSNTRVAVFDKDGKFLREWGQKGIRPNEKRPSYFNMVHGIAVDPVARRVYVNDRDNRRIQVFDENGKFLDMWDTGPSGAAIYSLYFLGGKVWASDAHTRRIFAWDPNGYLQYAWGGQGEWPGATDGIHGMSVDQEGNVYLADLFHGRVMKYRPRAGANPDYLMGKPVYAAWKD